MTYNAGTGITDPIDMLNKLKEVITGDHVLTIALVAGGTGYETGEILDLDGSGTFTEACQIEVLAHSAGVILTARIYRGGAYTADPGLSANATVSTDLLADGSAVASADGTGATFNLTMETATWSINRRTQQAASAVIGVGGTGYVVGELLTVPVGVQGDGGTSAIFYVATLSGSAVATVDLVGIGSVVGNYEEVPANDVSTTADQSGTGCTLTVTWEDATFALNEGQVCMIEGNGLAGLDSIHIGIKAFHNNIDISNDAYNWHAFGMDSYNAGLPIHQQAGVNPLQINTSTGDHANEFRGAYLVLKPDDADPDMEWWINHNGRRINLIVKVEGSATTIYTSISFGLGNQLATAAEYPYPLYVAAGCEHRDRVWTDNTRLTGGIVESMGSAGAGITADSTGPVYLKRPDGTWAAFCATKTGTAGTARSVPDEFGVHPFITGDTNLSQDEETATNVCDLAFAGSGNDFIPLTGVPGTLNLFLKPTPGTGADRYLLVAPLLVEYNDFPDTHRIHMEIDGVYWFARGNNTIVSEDRFEFGDRRYTIFGNGNRTQDWSYFALDED